MLHRRIPLIALLVLALAAACAAESKPGKRLPGKENILSKKRMGIQRYIEEKGLTAYDVPAALLIYESFSMAFMVSTLSIFYLLKPTKNGLIAPLTRLFGEPKPDSYLGGLSVRFQGLQLRARDKFQGISRALNLDAIALATAYAECACFRILVKPALVPIKLFLVYSILTSWKKKGNARGKRG